MVWTPAFLLVDVVGGLLGTDRFFPVSVLAAVPVVVSVVGCRYRDVLTRFFRRNS